MSELVITTNSHRRPLEYWEQLTEEEQKEFDWYDPCKDTDPFFRYKGRVYCLGEFMRTDHFEGWDGYLMDTYFSGILIRWPVEEWGDIDTDSIIVGWYYS